MPVSSTNAKILVVDDDRSLRSLLGLVLEEEGYAITEAQSGADCLRLFAQIQPDLVLLDAVMPDMDGFDCCRQLRSLPEGQRTPILMITFLDDQESIERAFQVGATDYITKPIHWPVLLQRLHRLMVYSQAIVQAEMIQDQLQDFQRWHRFYQQILSSAERILEPSDLFAEILTKSLDYWQLTQALFVYPQKKYFIVKSRDNKVLFPSDIDSLAKNFTYFPQSFEILFDLEQIPLTEAQNHFLAGFQAQTAIAIPIFVRQAPLAYLFFLEPYLHRWQNSEIEALQSLGRLWALLLYEEGLQ